MAYTNEKSSKKKNEQLFAHQFTKWIHKENFLKSGKLLDVGCGKGLFLIGFKKMGYDVSGVDTDNESVEISKKQGLNVLKCNLEKDRLPFKNNFFDYVFVRYVIPYVKNTENFIKEIKRVLKPSGLFFMVELDWNLNRKTYYNGRYRVKKRFTLESIKSILLSHGFEIIKARKFQNIPYIWRYTTKAFNFISLNPKSIIFIAKRS